MSGRAISAAEFADLIRPLGPFGPAPRLLAGVSGGPDSLALALLADRWARARGGRLIACICDHGLRAGSAAEAAQVAALLAGRAIEARRIRLCIPPGPALQARARAARLAALLGACAAEGAPWLLLGHQRGDQAETILLRALAGSGAAGLAAILPARAAPAALLLRPLLGTPRDRIEATLAAAGLAPLRDPSNADPRFTRARLRGLGGESALAEAAGRFAARRAAREAAVARRLAEAVALHPEGFARLAPAAFGHDTVAVAALRALIRAVAGAAFPPAEAATRALLARGEGTLAGAVLTRAGLLHREAGAIGPDLPARAGTLWDNRFLLAGEGDAACVISALGAEAPRIPRPAWLPAAAARALPAIRHKGALVAVPALAYPGVQEAAKFGLLFMPAGGPAA